MRLFIIGNGFDSAHSIQTDYKFFRKYLIDRLERISGKTYNNYDFTSDEIITSNYWTDEATDILVIMYFISCVELNDKWATLEKSLGMFDYSAFDYSFIDESEDEKEYRANWINQDIVEPYKRALMKISDYFREWIYQIEISNASSKNSVSNLIEDDTLFLSFNYTDTLETLYGVNPDKICYIHGKAKNGDLLHFGHGNNLNYDDFIDEISNVNYLSVADSYDVINMILKKDVGSILREKSEFFNALSSVTEVYSFGFSYGEVDIQYIECIVRGISKSAHWKINSYPCPNEKMRFKELIKKCGHSGKISEFD